MAIRNYVMKAKSLLENQQYNYIDLSQTVNTHKIMTGYWYAPKDDEFIYISNEIYHYLNIEAQEKILERTFFDFIRVDQKNTFMKHYYQSKNLGFSLIINIPIQTSNHYSWFQFVSNIDIDSNHQILGIYGTFKSINDEIELKNNYFMLQNKYEELITNHAFEIEQIKKQSLEHSQSKMMFLSNLSHEIRTPMNAIIGFVHLLDDITAVKEQKEYIHKINDASNHLMKIINDILDYSKIESGKITLEERVFRLTDLIDEVKSMVHDHALKKNIYLDIETMHLPEFVSGDIVRIKQILLNLLSNAIKFTETGGVSLVVNVSKKIDDTHQEITFKVKDSGIGMTTEQQQTIFNDFEQAKVSTSRLYGGTGLGLPISKRLANLMHGDITLQSSLNNGSEFQLMLPLKIENVKSKKIELTSKDLLKLPRKGSHILIADDHELSQKLLNRMLTNLGMVVSIATNGKTALELLDHNHYDLFILDLMMPVLNGIETTSQIRSKRILTPIIGLSGSVDDAIRLDCIKVGMNQLLLKPINPDLLHKILIEYLPDKNKKA